MRRRMSPALWANAEMASRQRAVNRVKRRVFMLLFLGGCGDGGGFLVEVPEEIIERLLDLHVHVHGNVDRLHFNRGGLDVQTAAQEQRCQGGGKEEASIHADASLTTDLADGHG